jgi:chemotaxis protein MotA
MLDRSTIIGLISGFTLIFLAILIQGELGIFASLTSLLIVVGGVVAATMVNFSFENIKDSFIAMSSMMSSKAVDLRTDMELLSMFARRVRTEGFLVLDGDIQHIQEPYLKNSLQLAVDGFKRESMESILRDEIRVREKQVEISINVLQSMSTYAPAFGMIGTVIGMVLVLGEIRAFALLFGIEFLLKKMGQEEHIMRTAFPKEYPEYEQRVKRLLPCVW